MLYILFGRDHIGKKTVRDYICKTYGIIIIPKYTDDKHKKWVLHDYETYTSSENYTLPKDLIRVREKKGNKSGTYICDENDFYLRWLSNTNSENIDAYCYEITKIYETDQYKARYYIRVEDIEVALDDKNNDYMLVCASGETIRSIERKALAMNLILADVIAIVHIEGDGVSTKTASWKYMPTAKERKDNPKSLKMDLPAVYLFECSQKFIGKIRNTVYKTRNNCMDQSAFEQSISLQWEHITGMLPINPQVFIVRSFRSKEVASQSDNINDLVENAIINIMRKYDEHNVLKFNKLTTEEQESTSSIYDGINRLIAQSHIVIVDLREHKNNCYYEYGYAMGLQQSYNRSKRIFCLIGTEKTDIKAETDIVQLQHAEAQKAYDILPFPHYKYICSKNYDVDEEWQARVSFVKESNSDQDFVKDIKKLIDIANKKKKVDIRFLAKKKNNI